MASSDLDAASTAPTSSRLLCSTVLGPWSIAVQSKKFQKGPLKRSRPFTNCSAPFRLRTTSGCTSRRKSRSPVNQ
jgi:hypothetical protein